MPELEYLEAGGQQIVYLIAYSRADVRKFPSRECFSAAVLHAWYSFGIEVIQWVTCVEGPDSGNQHKLNRYHFHMAIELKKRARWFQVRKYLDDNFAIQVNFSDNHNSYYSAYQHVTKEDKDALHLESHPDLKCSTKNRVCSSFEEK